MNRSTVHRIFAASMLFVMVLTSTGFTAIVKYCTMTETSECCCGDKHEGPSPVTDGLSISAPDAACFTQNVAGGRNEIAATLHPAESANQQTAAILIVDPEAVCAPQSVHSHSLLSTDDAAPPGVDIYIRVNSFLI